MPEMTDEETYVNPLSTLVRFIGDNAEGAAEQGVKPSVDVHFFRVQLRDGAKPTPEELAELIKATPMGEFGVVLTPDDFKNGPSYIQTGAWIGDQGRALLLYGLGQLVGLWRVITPKVLGVEGEDAANLAGMGMVMIGMTDKGKELL